MQRSRKIIKLDRAIERPLCYICRVARIGAGRTLPHRRRSVLHTTMIIMRPLSRILQIRRHIVEKIIERDQRQSSECDALQVPSLRSASMMVPPLLPQETQDVLRPGLMVVVLLAQLFVAGV